MVTGRKLSKSTMMVKILQNSFPEEEWKSEIFSRRNKKSRQRWLAVKIRQIFPNEQVLEDFLHKNIRRKSGSHLELDIFLPNLNIAVEFHGEQHYEDTWAGSVSLATQKLLDQEKLELCVQHKITLIVIPYSWDNSTESLITTFKRTMKVN